MHRFGRCTLLFCLLGARSARAQPQPPPDGQGAIPPDKSPADATRPPAPGAQPAPRPAGPAMPAAGPDNQPAATPEAARAQPDPAARSLPPAAPAVRPQPEPLAAPANGKKKKKKEKPDLALKGRIIARAEFLRRELEIVGADGRLRATKLDSLDLSVESARLELRYRSPIPGVTAEVGAEFATRRVRLRDAFIQARGEFVAARAGQFKPPGSPFETDSILTLPLADRGLVHELLVDRLEIGDRRPGVTVSAFDKRGIKPRLTLGAFQGSFLADEATHDTDLLAAQTLDGQNWVGRAELETHGIEPGVYVERRVGTRVPLRAGQDAEHFWAAGADVRLDWVFAAGGLRAWIDATAGESWYVHAQKVGDQEPTFVAGRVLVAYRFGGVERGAPYIEPFAMAGALDPDVNVTSDLAWEATLGVNAGFWRRGRVTLQASRQQTMDNFPVSYVLPDWRNRQSLIAQATLEL
jgi:hypothetical protein